ncbi:branched-chain amino acid ABC transporter permease [Thermogemmatispora sp.]|uniref:branched-chain amino acid ABC transporter permease n=1 Tax=Thermogemmatispora sp. TaxID=1968838 RepID=UPI001D8682A9|nr:branched-chain amino acid ABC transporter permease [Thermogemmatispora sp.]MBX5449420.1 branched-chain amino acid ABC transporter permease [Thermogemmatispora sp.]
MDFLTKTIRLIIEGLVTGSIYSLVALGYTMVYGIIELINFAHGDIFMMGTLVTLLLVTNVFHLSNASAMPLGNLLLMLVVSFLASTVICALLGVLIERVAYRPLRNAPRLAPLISAIGVSLALEDTAKAIIGPSAVTTPPLIPLVNYSWGPILLHNTDIIVLIVAVLLMVGLQWLVTSTRIGRAMRAVAQDREAAALMGVNVDQVIAFTFLVGAGIAGAGGFFFLLWSNDTSFNIGFELGLFAFTAAVLGGIGNLVGAMLGGLAIGLIRSLMALWPETPPFGLPHGGVSWQDAAVFAILILILVFRPTGLLGQQLAEKV